MRPKEVVAAEKAERKAHFDAIEARHAGKFVRVLKRANSYFPEIGTICEIGLLRAPTKTGPGWFAVMNPVGWGYYEVTPDVIEDPTVFEVVDPPTPVEVGDRFLYRDNRYPTSPLRAVVITEVDPPGRPGITRLCRWRAEVIDKAYSWYTNEGHRSFNGIRNGNEFTPLNRAAQVKARIKSWKTRDLNYRLRVYPPRRTPQGAEIVYANAPSLFSHGRAHAAERGRLVVGGNFYDSPFAQTMAARCPDLARAMADRARERRG
ncbi:MAG: hypothetical protein EOP83_05400 [Verrucomicrobiaceae bacterium]|nr:MAG: hypothetical protein EOP83_05400 [Verrucomicrobiaceae bacterium]